MEENLNSKFGYCGLQCEKCFAFIGGPINYHANKLKENLGDFDLYASRFVELLNQPIFGKYKDFKEFLNYLSSNNCKGCREQECMLFTSCNVKKCCSEKSLDYCFECNGFPCNNTGFDENLLSRWKKINERIRLVGLEKYYGEIKDKPRY